MLNGKGTQKSKTERKSGFYLFCNNNTFAKFTNVPKLFVVFIKRFCYVQGYETASKRAFVISIAFGLMSQPIKFLFSSLQTTAVVPLPK